MKHTTKTPSRASITSKTRMIGLRLEPKEMAVIEQMAKAEDRPLSQFARICLRRGMAELQVEKSLAKR